VTTVKIERPVPCTLDELEAFIAEVREQAGDKFMPSEMYSPYWSPVVSLLGRAYAKAREFGPGAHHRQT